MGNCYEVVLLTPHADYRGEVETALLGFGFVGIASTRIDGAQSLVWYLDSVKLGKGMPGLKEWVLELPWHDWGADTHLSVLWQDDYTMQDDSMHGRSMPYGWNHETWVIPTKTRRKA